jgi:CRP-like cAMP-binding protein
MRRHFQPGELIFREGDMANRFYLIESGRVAIEAQAQGKPVKVQSIGAGEVLGWSWLFPPFLWHFDARAEEETDALFFYATPLREHCEVDHALGYELMRRVAQIVIGRLHATRVKLAQSMKPEPALSSVFA